MLRHSSAVASAVILIIAWAALEVACWAQVPGICNVIPLPDTGESRQSIVRSALDTPPSVPMAATERVHPDNFRLSAFQDLLSGDNGSDSSSLLDESANDKDPLAELGPDSNREQERQESKSQDLQNGPTDTLDPHLEVYANSLYPSAAECGKCHQKIYEEWRVSGHAYAAVSPMFQRFEQSVHELTRGTAGTFCMRCHAPVATTMNHPREASLFDGPLVYREGVTCVVCHRVVEQYGRVNGERRIEPGGLTDPVVGNIGGSGIARAIGHADHFKVTTDPTDKRPYQKIHRQAIRFEQLSDSTYCASCHQVVVQPGVALEVVYMQYRAGPACKKGVSCQDCHMGAVPGKPAGYVAAPAAEVSGKTVYAKRKHSNHTFYGPGYSLAHPGIFPHNPKSLRWTAAAWLEFDWRAGWGTKEFEDRVAQGQVPDIFPPAWRTTDDRREARKIVDENLQASEFKRSTSQSILENGSQIDGPFFSDTPVRGKELKFNYIVSNTSEGHNMPSGSLGAQPQLWLNVVLVGPQGTRVWETGHLDSLGDLADNHSTDVTQGRMPADLQLFNMQSRFLISNVKGTDREMYLPFPVDVDPLPYLRPGPVPFTVLNHPPGTRMELRSIAPLDHRRIKYSVPAAYVQTPGVYRLSARLRSRVEPPYFARFVGATPEMLRRLNEGIIDVHTYSTEFIVH
jgi:nitrate/TMAO reductase-like tetraheme cytochrome c subunit